MLFVLLGGLFFLIYLYFTWNYDYWKKLKVDHEDPLFFFGNFKDVILGKKHFGEMYAELYRKFPNVPYIGFYKIRTPSLLIKDPELIKSVMVKDFLSFEKNDFEINDPLVESNLFVQTGEDWKKNRTAWSTGLTSSKLRAMYESLNEKADTMIEYLRNTIKNNPNEAIDARDISSSFFTDFIVTSVFGLKINSFQIKDNPFKKIASAFFVPSLVEGMKTLVYITAPWLGKIFTIRMVSKKMEKDILKIAKEIIEVRKEVGEIKNSPFDIILHGKHNNKNYRDVDVGGLMFNFLVDGTETSSGVSAYILYALAANPQVQTKLRQEIQANTDQKTGKVLYEDLHSMTYLDMVINETMRLYPAGVALHKLCCKPFEFPPIRPGSDPLIVVPGMPVIIPVWALHMDPQYFPDPERFDPERFNDQNKNNIPKFVFMPFGEGPRICIGQRLAMNQVKVGICSIIKNFEIRVSSKTKEPLAMEPTVLIMRPVGGIWLTFREIK